MLLFCRASLLWFFYPGHALRQVGHGPITDVTHVTESLVHAVVMCSSYDTKKKEYYLGNTILSTDMRWYQDHH